MAAAERHWVVTRDNSTSESGLAEGMLVPGDVDPELPWEQLQEVALATWGSRAGDDEVGERRRNDEMLLQFGWERSHGERGLHYYPVHRAPVIFRAVRGSAGVDVISPDDLTVASYELGAADAHRVLEQNGWLITHSVSVDAPESWAVRPFDWPRIVRHVSQARKSAQAKLEAAELGWREVVRAALLAGQDAKTLASLTGLTRQRIYQVRDGRR